MQVRCDRCDEFECICGDPAFEEYLVEVNEIDEEPEHDDSVKCCPDCERPNQFGDLCIDCQHERDLAENIALYGE